MRVDLLSLFPGAFSGPLDESIIKRAREGGLLDIRTTDIREYSEDPKHRRVDDRPYGGGPGMLLMPGPVCAAIGAVRTDAARVIYLSPQGKPLTAAIARELSRETHLILLCGAYEGVDQRAIDLEVDEEISIGDYVLTNGCLPALVLLDAVARFIPGVLGDGESASEDSFEEGLLDCPHYTRPESFRGISVPEVLRSGNHQQIRAWRREQAVGKTRAVRPDLLVTK